MPFRGVDEGVLDERQLLQRQAAQLGRVGRQDAPADELQALGGHFLLQDLARPGGQCRVLVQEHDAHGVQRVEAEAQPGGFLAHEGVGLLEQQATAVAGLAVGGDAATVGHARQRLDRGLHQPVAGLVVHLGDQAEAAVVAFELGGIQAVGKLVAHRR